ncbi:unnamed protein product [Cyclocybe aegerita]|uniref:Uncharacterized protein n=1 Tax=Cyclocybe aegerita TaxID=1973307 RepID=A0A8S0W8V3_CYCAE|nr:unnamed protein product [Cyclocybe aegerita]
MVAHVRPAHLAKRQDPVDVPTAVGITNGGITVGTDGAATATDALAFDTAAGTGTLSPPPFALTTTAPPPAPTSSSSSSSTSAAPSTIAAASTAKPIAMSTVIGTCIGAFIGASGLIALGLFVYRRYSRTLKQRANTRGPLAHSRNLHGNDGRRKSRLEQWNKLEDAEGDGDKWEGMYHDGGGNNNKQTTATKEIDQVAPMEKLTMFKKTPSVRTAYTTTVEDSAAFTFPQAFAPFDTNLAKTLTTEKPAAMPEPRPFLGRVDANPVISWDSQDQQGSSYLSVRSRMSSGGAMSPTLHMAIPTPPPTVSQPHRWESAEVVNFSEGQAAEVVNYPNQKSNNPFADSDEDDNRRSAHNPFFNAKDYTPRHRRSTSRSSSTRSRSNSRSRSQSQTRSRSNSVTTLTPAVKSAKAKGKERMRYSQMSTAGTITPGDVSVSTNSSTAGAPDPFDDMHGQLPRPPFLTHTATSSTSSMDKGERERALQSLIAVLDVPEEEVRDRLRIASMQPSIISQASSLGGEDVTKEFPLPPGQNRGFARP